MKRLKMLLGITAFVLAISAAFATKSSENLDIQGYIQTEDPDCISSITCSNAGGPECKTTQNEQVYLIDSGTSCNTPMSRDF